MRQRARAQSPAPGEEVSFLARMRSILRDLSVILAVAGAIGFVGGGALFLWAPDLRPFAQPVVFVGLGLMLLAAVASLDTVVATVTGRRGRYSANTVAMVLFLVLLVALVNFILFQQQFRFDTTATEQFSLADQTVQVLGDLDEPVRATAFFVPTERAQEALRRRADDLLYEFSRHSSNFSFRFVDPERDPSVARQYGVTEFSTVVFEAQESGKQRKVRTPPVAEQDFTSAVLEVTGTEQKRVYFLTGHGERTTIDLSSDTAFGLADEATGKENYQTRTLNLQEAGAIPDDTALLVIAGPRRSFLTRPVDERAVLEEYLRKGGNVLFLVDNRTTREWREVLAKWGVATVPGEPPQLSEEPPETPEARLQEALSWVQGSPATVVDQGSSITGDSRTPIVPEEQYLRDLSAVQSRYPRENPVIITRELDATFYPGAVGLRASTRNMPGSIRVTPLARTSGNSWVTPDPEDNTFKLDRDFPGPHTVAVAVEAVGPLGEEVTGESLEEREKTTRLVVFGDADFATNQYFYAFSNSDFFLNSINWLTGNYDLVSIRPKPTVFRELITTRQEFDFIRYSSLFLLPAALLMLGVVAWWRRR